MMEKWQWVVIGLTVYAVCADIMMWIWRRPRRRCFFAEAGKGFVVFTFIASPVILSMFATKKLYELREAFGRMFPFAWE